MLRTLAASLLPTLFSSKSKGKGVIRVDEWVIKAGEEHDF